MPLHHIGGIVANIYAPLASGSGAVYIAKFSAALVLNLDALSPKVTWIYCVPSHLQAILSARTPDTKPPSCVRLYRSGAAALPDYPAATGADAEKLGADVLNEAGAIAAWLRDEPALAKFDTLVVGQYIYLDGEKHVRASVAMDLITTALVSAAKVVPCRRSTPHALSRESSRTDPRDGPGAHRVRACFARDQRARVSL